jgi:hypothetical protein
MILLERILAHLGLILVGEKIHYFSAMITLKLDHKAHILALNDGAIASILLFKSFKKSPGIIVLMQSLNSRQGLTTVALLNTNMDVILGLRITNVVGERIMNFEIFDGHKQPNARDFWESKAMDDIWACVDRTRKRGYEER